MRYCKKCIQTDTRPNLLFTDDGVCMACARWDAHEQIDWNARERELSMIAAEARRYTPAKWDCVVGVSGGKDSHFQSFYARDVLGLRPLLINCVPENITDVGRANLNNLACHGFDLISIRPNPVVMRKLTKRAFYKFGNLVKPSEYPLFAVAWHMALLWRIPLVIEGENPADTLGLDLARDGDAFGIWKHGTIADPILDWAGDIVTKDDLFLYSPPSPVELRAANIRSVYLSHYAKEWSADRNTAFALSHGLRGRHLHDPAKTGKLTPYSALDSDGQIVNQMLKYYKLGFGATTEGVCQSVREGSLTRDQAIDLARRYDGLCADEYIEAFCEYIEITPEEFWVIVNTKWVNKALLERGDGPRGWVPRFTVGENFDEGR